MDESQPLSPGFLRIGVKLPRGESYTPGELARVVGVALDEVGPIVVGEGEAQVDVRLESGKAARAFLERIGPTRIVDWQWRWMKILIGRNHGMSMGQLRKIMQTADALPLGRISINNTHTLVGLQDFKIPAVMAKLAPLKINGFSPRPEMLPLGKGPGAPAFTPRGAPGHA